ncbi:MAG: crossover junction endodeoxyribonuclease RuvC [Gammaproteobacteria bacterium]
MARILGIDPGSLVTGYGVIDSQGQTLKYVDCGCVRPGGEEFIDRLKDIYYGIGKVVETYRPDEIAVERAFVHKNADSALKLGQARAAAICGTLANPVALYEYTPRAVKLSVVGKGGAGKEQVQHMVKILLGLRDELQADSADALAVALCHAYGRGLRQKLDRLMGTKR